MRDSAYARIGAFVCVALVLAFAALLLMGAFAFHKNEILFETYLEETVQGISVGSAVKFRGIPVGTVKSISFAFSEYDADDDSDPDAERAYRYARIVFAIDPKRVDVDGDFVREIETQIASGMRTLVKAQGVTGLAYLDLDYVDPTKPTLPVPWTPEYTYIPNAPSLTKTLSDALQGLAAEVHAINENHDTISNIVAKVASVLDNANAALLSARTALDAAPPALDDFRASARAVSDASVSLLSHADSAVARAETAIAGADAAIADLRARTAPALDDLSRSSASLAEILEAVRADPARWLRHDNPKDMP